MQANEAQAQTDLTAAAAQPVLMKQSAQPVQQTSSNQTQPMEPQAGSGASPEQQLPPQLPAAASYRTNKSHPIMDSVDSAVRCSSITLSPLAMCVSKTADSG